MIKDYVLNTNIREVLLCKEAALAKTANGKPYYNVIFGDASGTISAKIWNTQDVFANLVAGTPVLVCAIVSEYQGNPQLNVEGVWEATSFEWSDLLPSTPHSIKKMTASLLQYVDSVQNKWCRALLDYFFRDDKFLDVFCEYPAAIGVHHAYIGGLLEHTLMVAAATARMQKLYSWLNYDLMVTSALLHDIGKLHELTGFPQNEYSLNGHCIGHVCESAFMVREASKSIKGFPETIIMKVLHCLLAHHGKLEYGSPKLPAIPEAFAVSQMDYFDSQLKIFESALQDNEEWKTYNKYLGVRVGKGTFDEDTAFSIS